MSERERGDDSEVRSEEEPSEAVAEDTLFVAVGKEFKKGKSTIVWALQNSGGRKLCILHVHLPAQTIPVLGGKFPISQVREEEVKVYHEKERIKIFKVLDEYAHLCNRSGVVAQRLYTEADSIEKAIVTLIPQKKIVRLVMGAADDGRYSRRMVELKSKKAIYVCNKAPDFCHIQFVCKGRLIHTRQSRNPPKQLNNDRESKLGSVSKFNNQKPSPAGAVSLGSPVYSDEWSTSGTSLDCEESYDDCDRTARSVSESVGHSSSPSSIVDRIMALQLGSPHSLGNLDPNISCVVLAGKTNVQLYDQLVQATEEAEHLRRQSFSEYFNATRADNNIAEAIRKAKALEVCYFDELMKRKRTEDELVKKSKELEMAKAHQDRLMEELSVALYQKSYLENKIEKSRGELEHDVTSTNDPLQKDNQSNTSCITEFSFLEIVNATDNFNPSMKIGEGGYGSTYRGFLRQTEVAIKILNPSSRQGFQEFQQEVNVLSKLRHPNIVTLVGIYRKASAIVYEYVPSGNLEDRLSCRGDTPPLSWKKRLRIATDICLALVFLHTNQPHNIIHGDLKPSNILLDDARSTCKLSDFGISHTVSHEDLTVDTATTRFCLTQPKGTFCYMDPEFLSSGELTLKSDIYSYGIIVMQLLTGKRALAIRKEVEDALHTDKLEKILDPLLAGDWSYDEAKLLACVALRCSEMSRKNRPDHINEVWKVIEPIKSSLLLESVVPYEEGKRLRVPCEKGKRVTMEKTPDLRNCSKPAFYFRNGIL